MKRGERDGEGLIRHCVYLSSLTYLVINVTWKHETDINSHKPVTILIEKKDIFAEHFWSNYVSSFYTMKAKYVILNEVC